jgi:hypothetical protein
MSFKKHVHEDGKVCYRNACLGSRRFDKALIFREKGIEYAAGFSSYSNTWYLFDTATGSEVGSLKPSFFDVIIRPKVVVSEEYMNYTSVC